MSKQRLGPNQEKWLAALETTTLRQNKNSLCRKLPGKGKYAYCCLGIADRVIGNYNPVELIGKVFLRPLTCERLKIRSKFGVPKGDIPINLTNSSNSHTCIVMNDSLGYSFKKIAKILRDHPEQYFTGPA